MQLKKKIVGSLAAATCSLLSAASGPSIAAEEIRKWEFDTALLYYGETDRVTDASFRFHARKSFRNAGEWLFSLSIDSLTGSSANGAMPANMAQTFTTPSGAGSYVVQPGQMPLDPTFFDTREALTASWSRPIGKWRTNIGASISNEYDYLHAGINGGFNRDFNNRNTSFVVGLGFANDSIDPVGGVPIPFAPMLPDDDSLAAGFPGGAPPSSKIDGGDTKTVIDLLVGITQVLSRKTIAQFNYSISRAEGYLSDPYKLISVVDAMTGDPAPGPGNVNLYRFESRPDERTKHSVFAQVKHHFGRDFIDGSYRFMTDDWGVMSHAVDLRYRWKWRNKSYWQPHVRWYTQTATDFYVYSLTDGATLPLHASSDYRLGRFDAYTVGLKYGRPMGGRREWSVRVEYYNQSGNGSPSEAIGSQRSFDLYPTVDAVIVQAGFNF
ncbi:MAG: DUF3570 domain-containing protein [Acidobacteriota bacterium]